MNRRELERSWERTRAHLAAAAALLPQPARDGEEGGRWSAYVEYLAHNELELALDELEMLADANPVPPRFWSHLGDAAAEMKMTERRERYARRARA